MIKLIVKKQCGEGDQIISQLETLKSNETRNTKEWDRLERKYHKRETL